MARPLKALTKWKRILKAQQELHEMMGTPCKYCKEYEKCENCPMPGAEICYGLTMLSQAKISKFGDIMVSTRELIDKLSIMVTELTRAEHSIGCGLKPMATQKKRRQKKCKSRSKT